MMSETIDITNPGDPINITPFSEREARQLTEEVKRDFENLGEKLLEAYRRRAWEPLGYSNFVEYSNAEFGRSKTEAYRLLNDVRVTSSLFPEFGKEEIKELSVSQKELLLKLPSEQRAEALKEAQRLAQDEGRKRSTAQHVRRIVEKKMALPPRKSSALAGVDSPPTSKHRPKWANSQKFQLDHPFFWVEYSPLPDGCQFDFYVNPGGKLLDSCELTFDEVDSYGAPQVAAEYLAKTLERRKDQQERASDFVLGARIEVVCPRVFVEMPSAPSGSLGTVVAPLDKRGFILVQLDEAPGQGKRQDVKLTPSRLKLLEQNLEEQKIVRLEAQLNRILEEKERLEAQSIEQEQIIAGLKLHLLSSEAELNQLRALVGSVPFFYCGETIQGLVEVQGKEGKTKKPTLLEISSESLVKLLPDVHSQPELCYVRPFGADDWLEGIAVKRSDLKLQLQHELRDPQPGLLDEALETAAAQRLVIEEYERENNKLKRDLKLSEEIAQKNFQERNEMWARFQEIHFKNQQIQAELDARCQQLALESSESFKELVSSPEKPPSFSVGEIKTRTQLEQLSSRRQMDKARDDGYLNLSDGSKWRQVRREGNELLWQSLGHRPATVLFECVGFSLKNLES